MINHTDKSLHSLTCQKSPTTAGDISTLEYELSNHLNTVVNSYAFICILQTGAFCIFSKVFLKNRQKSTSKIKFFGLRDYERGHFKIHRFRGCERR